MSSNLALQSFTCMCKTISFSAKVVLDFPLINRSDLDFKFSLSIFTSLNKALEYGNVYMKLPNVYKS